MAGLNFLAGFLHRCQREGSGRRFATILVGVSVIAPLSVALSTSPADASVSGCTQSGLQALMNSGGSVTFASNCHLYLGSPLTVGPGTTVVVDGTGHQVILDGYTLSQVFVVDGGNLTLQNLTVANGIVYGISGISGASGIDGTAPSSDGTDGSSTGVAGQPGRGGGIYVAQGASVTAIGVTFSGDQVAGGLGGAGGNGGSGTCPWIVTFDLLCSSRYNNGPGGKGGNGGSASDGGPGQGGAIFNAGSLTVGDSSFVSDIASGGNAGAGGSGGYGGTGAGPGNSGGKGGDGSTAGTGGDALGGAIYNAGSGSMMVVNSSFTNDGAAGGLGGHGGFGGGGGFGTLDANSASYTCPPGVCAMGGAAGNGASGGNGGNAYGGAVYNAGTSSLTNITFTGNTVNAGLTGVDCANSPNSGGCGGPAGQPGSSGSGDGAAGTDGPNGNSGMVGYPDTNTVGMTNFHITTTSLPNGTRGIPYDVQLTATLGQQPYKWRKIAPLPKGLKLNSSGLLSGVPSLKKLTAGTYIVSVEAKDSTRRGHQVATATLALSLS